MASLTAANFAFLSPAEPPKAAPAIKAFSADLETVSFFADHGLSHWLPELRAEPIHG
jgi:hypothetical protein